MSSEVEDKLYKARYYLKRAHNLSTSTGQRLATDEAYLKAKYLMGKEEKVGAKGVHSSADQARLLNKQRRALNLYLKAAELYLYDEKYGKAQRDFLSGLDIALNLTDSDTTKYLPDLIFGLATSYLLENEPQKCLDTLKQHAKIKISTKPSNALDSDFLYTAANLLLVKGHRKALTLWKKNLSDEEHQHFKERFVELIQLQQKQNGEISKEKKILLARAWYLIAGHSHDLNLVRQGKQALELAQSLFYSVGLKEEALDIGKELEDYKMHSQNAKSNKQVIRT
jgi:hypothetical protein